MRKSSTSVATRKPAQPSNDNDSTPDGSRVITVPDPRRLVQMIALGVFTGGLRYMEEVSGRRLLRVGEPEQSDVMTADEVAEYLGVDRNTVYEYAARGVIPHKRLGKRMIFRRGSIIAWLDTAVVGGEG